jgi:hypothetical protein
MIHPLYTAKSNRLSVLLHCICFAFFGIMPHLLSAQTNENGCPLALVSFTATGANTVPASNTATNYTAVVICDGGNMTISPLSTNTTPANLRFREATNSNGNVAFMGFPVPINRTPQDLDVTYFDRVYGSYALLDPKITGTLSETFTPYIDLNGNQQFDDATECYGQPVILNYEIVPVPTFSFTASGSNTVQVANTPSANTATVQLCAGGWMGISPLTTNVRKLIFRFIEATNSNGNVRFMGFPVPVNRTQQDLDSAYFDNTYGTYTLIDPTTTGTLSETFTPYVDLNGDGQYNSGSECLGEPIILNYIIEANSQQATVQSGNWTTRPVWSCGQIPTSLERVIIRHAISLPAGYVGQLKGITYEPGGVLLHSPTSQLLISN